MACVKVVDLSDTLDPSKLGSLIGRRGYIIKGIEQKNKVLLGVESPPSGPRIRITGMPDNVSLAVIDIQQTVLGIIKESITHTFRIPSRMVGYLIGSHGMKLDEIKNGAGVCFDIMPATAGSTTTEVRITGTFTSILTATNMVKDRLDSFGKNYNPHEMADRKEFLESWDEVVYDN